MITGLPQEGAAPFPRVEETGTGGTGTNRERFRVIHAPSNPEIKGTALIERAVAAVNGDPASAVEIELVLCRGVPRTEVFRLASTCDFAIDQVLIGWYGIFAVEMLTLGLPVLCFLDDRALDQFRQERDHGLDPPIERVSADRLAGDLKRYCTRRALGEPGADAHEFLAAEHSPTALRAFLRTEPLVHGAASSV